MKYFSNYQHLKIAYQCLCKKNYIPFNEFKRIYLEKKLIIKEKFKSINQFNHNVLNLNSSFIWTRLDDPSILPYYGFIATLDVPYFEGSVDNFTLSLIRVSKNNKRRIKNDIILFNPGGPGASIDFYVYYFGILYPELLETYDIIAWDPRGVGLTTPSFDYITGTGAYLDTYVASTNDVYNVTAQGTNYWINTYINLQSVWNNYGNLNNSSFYNYVSSNDTVDDIKRILDALGVNKLNYLGYSYGTSLGSIFFTKYPEYTGKMFWSGVVNVNTTDLYTITSQQINSFTEVLLYFFEHICTDPSTPFYYPTAADAQQAYIELIQKLASNPIPGRASLPQGINDTVAYAAVFNCSYYPLEEPSGYQTLSQILADARSYYELLPIVDPTLGLGLLNEYDIYNGYDTISGTYYDNLFLAYYGITYNDTSPISVSQSISYTNQYIAENQLLGVIFFLPMSEDLARIPPFIQWNCIPDDPEQINTIDNNKILMCTCTLDPATPFLLSKQVFNLLKNASLIAVKYIQHTYYPGPAASINNIINNFFITGNVGFRSICVDGYTGDILPCLDCDICDIICYAGGTKILCKQGYIAIEDISPFTMVKTYKHGYQKVKYIGKGTMINNPNKPFECMYRKKAIENFDDLVVTGGHGILKQILTRKEINDDKYWFLKNKNSKIDDMYLQRAAFCSDFEKITTKQKFNYYHIVLENNSKLKRYGIWANGVLSESTYENALKIS